MREKPNGRRRANANKNISQDPTQPAMQQGHAIIVKKIGICKSMSLCGDLKEQENMNEENGRESEGIRVINEVSKHTRWRAECLL